MVFVMFFTWRISVADTISNPACAQTQIIAMLVRRARKKSTIQMARSTLAGIHARRVKLRMTVAVQAQLMWTTGFFDPDRDIDLLKWYADKIAYAETTYTLHPDRPKCRFEEDDEDDGVITEEDLSLFCRRCI